MVERPLGGESVRLPVGALLPADSPRANGVDQAHVRLLAEAESALPPVLVHRATLRVIDGMHRLNAAIARGEETIEVTFFDGDESELFLQSVRLNVTHGLPLSLQERKHAAARLMGTHARLSDRAVAAVTGLSPKTVGAIRHRSSEEIPHSNTRIGADGRAHPMDAARRRQVVADVVAQRPDATLREIAAIAGVSVSTAYQARRRMEEQAAPQESVGGGGEREPGTEPRGQARPVVPSAATSTSVASRQAKLAVKSLAADPSLRFTESGRALLRLLLARVVEAEELEVFLDSIPPHCAGTMADLARDMASTWGQFSHQLRKRVKQSDQ
ncbi:ParB/RepB/Spo0J family partition protein [Streptomyces sp. NPDC058086]|uniref:ParB/RepB/Spo0J family partition protein n=1 Tax=Streptomyces sp. NPDC058086 TaxID=3346334 RepID=UPI0036ED6EE2